MGVDWYCPACGRSERTVDEPLIAPGDIPYTCSECGTRWRISMEFHEMKGNAQSRE